MKLTLFLPVTLIVLFISCGQANSHQGVADTTIQSTVVVKPVYDLSLVKGEITDSVVCKYADNQSYALYLPSYYTADKKFPCIYFFDAHARGLIPVVLCKDFAEKYGFVLIGSNVSKNGMQWPQTAEIVQSLMNDTRSRIHIDTQRVYTAGFSGGARVASTVAILNGGIAGVIGCAAGFPGLQEAFQNKFDYFGMVGVYDFNLNEIAALDQSLEQHDFSHQLLTFEGKHEWPSGPDMQTAFLWLQVNGMKEQRQPKNDTIVITLKNDYDKRIAAAASSGDVLRAYTLLTGLTRVLDGFQDVTAYKKQVEDMANSTAYKHAIALQAQLQQTEVNQQQAFQQQFTTQNEAWWAKEIASLKQAAHNSATKQVAQMNQRLLNYLGLIAYLTSNQALHANDLMNVPIYLKLFKMADPKNPDACYLSAIYYVKKEDNAQAIQALNEAVKLGYNDAAQITTDPELSNLYTDARFREIVNKVCGQATK